MSFIIMNGRGEIYGGPEGTAHVHAWYETGEYSAFTFFDDETAANDIACELNLRIDCTASVIENYGQEGAKVVTEYRRRGKTIPRFRRYKDFWFAEMEAGQI